MKEPLTVMERYLVLDAALCANEMNYEIPFSVQQSINVIQAWLDGIFDVSHKDKDFDLFLKEQAEAVEKLTKCPEVFGHSEETTT
jgi:hypothetical protein